MRRFYSSCFVALVLFVNARADEKKQKTEESPRLAVALQLSVETYDPNQPAGTLTVVVHNRSTEEVRLPAAYDGRTLIIYGSGKTHRGSSRLWRPNRNADGQPRFVTIGPGKKETVFDASLKDILTPQTDRAKVRRWAWDWSYRFEPPRTPIHGWRREGFEKSASFAAELRMGKEPLRSEAVVLTVKTAVASDEASQSAMSQTITVNTRDQIVKAVQQAKPGAKILIAPGTYQGGLHFNGLQGEKGKPIILAAADKENPPVFKGRNSCFHLTDPAFVELHNLVLTEASGNGLNIDDGGSYDSPAQHVVLHGLTIRDIGPEGNRDAIKLSGLDNFRVENCNIERWGTSGSGIDMVGCHRGDVLGCTFRYRSDLAANGVQTKGGSKDIVIRWCRFENAGGRSVNIGGSTGLAYFRPKVDGYEAKDIAVEDCTFIGSSAPICFVGVDGAVARYNTIYRPKRYVVRILQESRGNQFVPCRNGIFSNNVIAFRSDETRGITNIGAGTAPKTFKIANNHWYCIDRPERSNRLSLPVQETGGSYGKDPQFSNAAKGDVRLKSTSPVQDAGVRVVDSQ